MPERAEIEFVFEPEEGGGYRVYAPELPGLHTEGEDIKDATANAQDALVLYIEGLREDGQSLEFGVIRRTVPIPAEVRSSGHARRHPARSGADRGPRYL